jgi:hypothetical protein
MKTNAINENELYDIRGRKHGLFCQWGARRLWTALLHPILTNRQGPWLLGRLLASFSCPYCFAGAKLESTRPSCPP